MLWWGAAEVYSELYFTMWQIESSDISLHVAASVTEACIERTKEAQASRELAGLNGGI